MATSRKAYDIIKKSMGSKSASEFVKASGRPTSHSKHKALKGAICADGSCTDKAHKHSFNMTKSQLRKHHGFKD